MTDTTPHAPDLLADTGVANDRRRQFVDALSQELKDREDRLPLDIARENASAKTKLRRIYRLVDEISAARASSVACKAGCADCCRMNVSISSIEAQTISAAIGRAAVALSQSVHHKLDKFVGSACPFLQSSHCSIYENRPLACRTHASFYPTARWCSPDYMNTAKVSMVGFSGVAQAYTQISFRARSDVTADIRDFFPA